MIPRDEIIRAHPIADYLSKIGHPVSKSGSHMVACCPFHDDKTPSMSVNLDKQVWFCHAGGFGGSVIDIVCRQQGLSVKDAIKMLADEAGIVDETADGNPHTVATYTYRDQHGRPVMKVDRIEQNGKKKFAQYIEDENGNRKNGISGVQRVLYRMEKWAGREEVALAEGEKCVHALERLGWDATCNPAGASSWLDAYSCYLTNKHVDIWADNDASGEKWVQSVLKSLEGKVASLRVLRVPDIYGDVADMIDAQGDDMASETIINMLVKIPRISRGVQIPLLSAEECYEVYKRSVHAVNEHAIDLGKWLPSLRHHARVLLPGDLAVFLSDTGIGKTSALANIAYSQRPIPTIFFELELSPEAMCERFIARDTGVETLDVERRTIDGDKFDVRGWDHVFICPESRMTIEKMEEIINRAELKIQAKPRLILVDYVGLMGGGTGKRYERMSTLAEGMKILARTTETVVILASQVRRDSERVEVDLHDAKDSGSVENSAQLVMGAWRPAIDRMTIKLLKQTKRAGQHKIECRFDGHRQTITELTQHKDNYNA
jgi:hypothetical protein